MGMLDGLFGQIGQHVDVANLAAKVGLSEEQVQSAIGALAEAHAAPGDTAATAAEATGLPTDTIQQIIGHVGEGSLGRFAEMIGQGGGEGGVLGSLSGLAGNLFGSKS